MTIVKRVPRRTKKYRPNLWFEKLMALIAVINLAIVAFDLSYIPLRDFRPLAHFYYTFDNEWRLNPEELADILDSDGNPESCYSTTGDFQSESFVYSHGKALKQIFNEIKKITQNRIVNF